MKKKKFIWSIKLSYLISIHLLANPHMRAGEAGRLRGCVEGDPNSSPTDGETEASEGK